MEGGDGDREGGWDVRVEGAGAVKELEVEGDGCLAVDLSVWGGLHRHFRGGGGDARLVGRLWVIVVTWR